ncbi:MAG: bifunctional folylpolyglutamate synthase/dihydrofolate synthase [Candidatus Acidiferrales bacterium]
MTYDEAVRYLLTLGKELAAPQQARVQKFDLANISILSESLGSPHRAVPCVHIAGTNGKGSTAAMLDSILRFAGLRSGLYTSPHLERINERIRIAGEEISDSAFAESFTRVETQIEELMASGALAAHPTFFECLTAVAYDAFARAEINFAVYEVGMGGRLDATNIVTPEVAVITQIDFDHEAYLGHSIEQIAAEKAGIIKPGGWVVSSAERPEARTVIARTAAAMDARLVEIDGTFQLENLRDADGGYSAVVSQPHSTRKMAIDLPLPGRFQLRNALAALAAARLLAQRGFPLDDDSIAHGLAAVRWPGRLEKLMEKPALYLDGAHNPAGARELLSFWKDHFQGRKIFLIYGAMRDKAVDEISGLLFPRVHTVILTEPRQSRAISVEVLREMTHHHAQNLEMVSDPVQALERVFELAHSDDVIFVTGSLYLVGDLRGFLLERRLPARSLI